MNVLFTQKKCDNLYLEIGASTFVYFSGKGPFIILTRMILPISTKEEEINVSSFFCFFAEKGLFFSNNILGGERTSFL